MHYSNSGLTSYVYTRGFYLKSIMHLTRLFSINRIFSKSGMVGGIAAVSQNVLPV